MDLTRWYALSLIILIVLLFVHRLCTKSITIIHDYGLFYLSKYVIYPILVKRRNGSGSITRLQGILLFGYLSANGISMSIGVRTLQSLQARAGIMATINLLPVFLGGRTNFLMDKAGLSLHNYYLIHHWIGRVVVVQGVIHASLAMASSARKNLNAFQLSGLVSGCVLLVQLLSSFCFVRRRFYEVFIKLHFCLALTFGCGLVIHLLGTRSQPLTWMALSAWGLNHVLSLIRSIYRNIGGTRTTDQVVIREFTDPSTGKITAAQVDITLPRPWTFRAGQYVYLRLPNLHFWAFLQAHPYNLVWWDQTDSRSAKASFIVEPRAGMTRDLVQRRSLRKAIIDGPYGTELDFGSFETVLMFVAGIGIAGVLPYVRRLIEGRRERKMRTRRLYVGWLLERECHQRWIATWMDKILSMDKEEYILSVELYVPTHWENPATRYGDREPKGEHGRLLKLYEQPDIPLLLKREALVEAGDTVIAVCGSPKFSTRVRNIAVSELQKGFRFAELAFRPDATIMEDL